MQWFSDKGIKEGDPQEITTSVALSKRKEISQLKVKSMSTQEKTQRFSIKKLSLNISI